MSGKTAALLAAGILASGAAAYAQAGALSNAGGDLVMKTGDYQLRLIKSVCYTPFEFTFKGRKLLSASRGASNGTVLMTLVPPENKVDYVGAGHGHETVESARAFADGKELVSREPSAVGRSSVGVAITAPGKEFRVEKHSDLLIFTLDAITVLTPAGLTETNTYAAKKDNPPLDLLYVFMHSFDNDTKHWILQTPAGEIKTGDFIDNEKFTVESPILWTAVYNPTNKTGAVYVLPQAYAGNTHFYWDRKEDNKLYFRLEVKKDPVRQQLAAMRAGDKMTFSVKLAAFESPEEKWKETAQAKAKELQAAWKAELGQPKG